MVNAEHEVGNGVEECFDPAESDREVLIGPVVAECVADGAIEALRV